MTKTRGNVYVRNLDSLDDSQFKQVRTKILEQYEMLRYGLKTYCLEKHGIQLSDQVAESYIEEFVTQNHYMALLGTIFKSNIKAAGEQGKYLMGSYINHLKDTGSVLFTHFESIVHGEMLANAMYLPDTGTINRKFIKTTVFFDTSFLIYALGWAGKSRQEPCDELLQLLKTAGASLRCFPHTVEEMRGILEGCKYRLKQGNATRDSHGTIEYFIMKGYSVSDIEVLIQQIDVSLRKLGITIQPTPEYIPEYTIDERALKEHLASHIPYHRTDTLEKDVRSLSAVTMLRRGVRSIHLEQSRAIFISTNHALVSRAVTFFSGDDNRPVPPIMSDTELTTRLWIKDAKSPSNLPRKLIIADCYAAMQPNERLWTMYTTEIEKLRESHEVSSEEYVLLCHSVQASEALMEMTLGEDNAFTRGTVGEILEHIKDSIRAEETHKLDEVRKELAVAETTIQQNEQKIEQAYVNLHAQAQSFARIVSHCLLWPILTLFVVVDYLAFPWRPDVPKVLPRIWFFTFGPLTLVIFLVFTISSQYSGVTIRGVMKGFQNYIAQKRLHRIQTKFNSYFESAATDRDLD